MVFDQARPAGWIFGVTFSSRTSLLAAPVLHRHLQASGMHHSSTFSPTAFAPFTHPTLIPRTKAPQLSEKATSGVVLFGLVAILALVVLSYVEGYVRSLFLLPFPTSPFLLLRSLPH